MQASCPCRLSRVQDSQFVARPESVDVYHFQRLLSSVPESGHTEQNEKKVKTDVCVCASANKEPDPQDE